MAAPVRSTRLGRQINQIECRIRRCACTLPPTKTNKPITVGLPAPKGRISDSGRVFRDQIIKLHVRHTSETHYPSPRFDGIFAEPRTASGTYLYLGHRSPGNKSNRTHNDLEKSTFTHTHTSCVKWFGFICPKGALHRIHCFVISC